MKFRKIILSLLTAALMGTAAMPAYAADISAGEYSGREYSEDCAAEDETNTYLQFALSSSADFAQDATIESGKIAWNMWNPHRQLEPGTWYWRFRNISSTGEVKEWSDTYSFEVKGSEPVFVTPTWDTFLSMAPQFSPRLYCFPR